MKPLKLEEITPDKLLELEAEAQNNRLHELTLHQMRDLVDKRLMAERHLHDLEIECQLRAIRAYNLGFSKKDLASIFKVTPNTIKKWVG